MAHRVVELTAPLRATSGSLSLRLRCVMASAVLSRRVEKVVTYRRYPGWATVSVGSSMRRYWTPTASRICPGKWQAAILNAEENRPNLRLISGA
jgi:hypothetical protein